MRCTRRQRPRFPVLGIMLCRPLSRVSYGVRLHGILPSCSVNYVKVFAYFLGNLVPIQRLSFDRCSGLGIF